MRLKMVICFVLPLRKSEYTGSSPDFDRETEKERGPEGAVMGVVSTTEGGSTATARIAREAKDRKHIIFISFFFLISLFT
jgi:hypothetical protein